jgi:hypothetical protein
MHASLSIDLIECSFKRVLKVDVQTSLKNRENSLPIHFQKAAPNAPNHVCHHFLIDIILSLP